MRLTTVILIAFLMQVSAAGFAQKITLNQRNTTLESILKEIRKQSGYDYYFDSEIIPKDQKINISVKDASIDEALKEAIAGLSLSYKIEGKIISIQKKEPSFLEDLIERIQAIDVRGKVLGENRMPLEGATIVVKGKNRTTKTNARGEFSIGNLEKDAVLVISFIGYKTQEFSLAKKDAEQEIVISLVMGTSDLEEVAVASNGYEEIPKERSTGSFEVITAKMLEHSSSPNLLQRLEGITNSIVFDNTLSPTNSSARALVRIPGQTGSFSVGGTDYNGGYTIDNMTIRGKNSLNGAAGVPLVVIDGIANPYDISLLNPDDVESITILKDASSASIWGSRAANGVLVIKTKRGRLNQPFRVAFNTNLTIGEKFDLFYVKKASISDFIDLEIYGFNQQSLPLPTPVATAEGNPRVYSPVVEILDAIKKNTISQADGQAQIDVLRGNDFRKDQEKYLLRNPITQNYSLNLSGGSSRIATTLNGGYSSSRNNTVNNGTNKINVAYHLQLNLLKDLDLSASINYNTNRSNSQGTLAMNIPAGSDLYAPYFMPYTRLANDDGNPSEVNLHRPGFLKALSEKYGSKILDNSYYPLNELDENYKKDKKQNLGFSADARYRLNAMFSASMTYNYNLGLSNSEQFYSGDSYYMRDLINLYTDPATLVRAIPLGGLLMPQSNRSHNQTIRGLISFNNVWNKKNELNASAGVDIAESVGLTQPTTGYYGYDPNTLKTSNVRFLFNYPLLYPNSGNGLAIPNGPNGQFLETVSRTLGQFFNVGYTYDRRYTVTGSIRKDGNNAFGNKTNRTGTPFYHLGTGWNIMNETFYHATWLPSLKIRYTFGYNGNTNPGPTAEPRFSLTPNSQVTLLNFGRLSSLPNAELRPERTATHNLGLDFGFAGGRVTGTLEYFVKKTTDLIAVAQIDPTLGFLTDNYNVANLYGDGIDLDLTSTNLRNHKFSWGTNFRLSKNSVKVTKNYVPINVGALQVLSGGRYIEGSSRSALYAWQWAGLDPVNGEPRIFIDGVPTVGKNTSTVVLFPKNSLKEVGSSVPVYYGNLGNTFQYSGLTLSFNLLWKLGYYQRRRNLLQNNFAFFPYAEYAERWQQRGDELKTNVPSLDYARSINNPYSDMLYLYADINTYRADNVRLQEVNFSYSLPNRYLFIKNVRLYVNMPLNIILWRANKLGLDPDVFDFPTPKTYTFGISTQF